MIKFSQFLIEMVPDTEKLSHIEHAEDHVLNADSSGTNHATRSLIGVHHALLGHNTPVKVTTKYDGAPSIIFGTHPENKKFFVASKSAFNKNPKINHTPADIERNHGHAPGLVHKLTSALEHLPKVTPHGKIYQGDLMYTHRDVKSDKSNLHFTPNTIKYSVSKADPVGKKVKASKIGIAVHTEYKGDSVNNLKAHFGVDHTEFKAHDDVHVIHTKTDVSKANYTPKMRHTFFQHIDKAKELSNGHNYDHLKDVDHLMHLKTYINQTVRHGTSPSVKGLAKHVAAKHEVLKANVKMDKTKAKIEGAKQQQLSHINTNAGHIDRTLKIHKHVQDAKNVLVKALASSDDFEHSINNKKTGPEGHVALLGSKPTKLVDRSEGGFASSNLLASGIAKQKNPK
jgi:hypothetical protein